MAKSISPREPHRCAVVPVPRAKASAAKPNSRRERSVQAEYRAMRPWNIFHFTR